MGATIQHEKGGIWVLRISGALRKEEMDVVQAEGLEGMGLHDEAKVLVIIDDSFHGWVGGEVWNDMTFFVQHGDRIVKIAIVGDPKWETRMLMFTGAGFRRGQVKYFAKNHFAEAYAWLS